ncbi:MAG: DHH family phosphoesterase [Methanomassiliicoccales archaeon]|jgi:nanoRNase/pAp phosphatase (c-di-AMP/oligoRNAs hydrolase)|nr:DHH family phosphoesterase [Methanomassiliicoccales archaeon]
MLNAIVQRLQIGKKLILLHGNADPDALGCAFAICRCFPEATIIAPGGLDRISKIIAEKLNITVFETIDLSDYDTFVVVDTSSPDQLDISLPSPEKCIVIDHHAFSDRWSNCLYYCDDSKRSCAEIVFEMLKTARIEITRDVGLALLSGMLTDSGHFAFATPSLLRDFADIMEKANINMDEVTSFIDIEPDISERISQLKGAQRLRFERTNGYIVAISHGSAFESSVCKSLIMLGADVAFVGSQRNESFRVSARARPEIVRKGLHLGKMLEDIGTETSNDGGGHGGAAGLMGVGDIEAILNICMQRALDFLRRLEQPTLAKR